MFFSLVLIIKFLDNLQAASAEMIKMFFVQLNLKFHLVGGRTPENVCSQSCMSAKATRMTRNDKTTNW